jgi:hypothetical protein
MPATGHTKFQPLIDYLAVYDGTEIALTYVEIEKKIGGTLSDTAHADSSTWASAHFIHVQKWRALGWRARLDRRKRRVVFTRIALAES